MSTPPPQPPPGNPLTGAIVWTLAAAAVAVFAFVKAADAGDKRTFYTLVGVVAVIAVLVNGFGAWHTYQKSKTPPAP
jgi:hypothetical protein